MGVLWVYYECILYYECIMSVLGARPARAVAGGESGGRRAVDRNRRIAGEGIVAIVGMCYTVVRGGHI